MNLWAGICVFLCLTKPSSLLAERYEPGEHYEHGDLVKVAIRLVHPTQFAVGMDVVKIHKDQFRKDFKYGESTKKELLKESAGNAVIGPEGEIYLVDGHHHARALYELGEPDFYVEIDKDWSHLSPKEFWKRMSNLDGERARTRVRLVDENGKNRRVLDLPRTVAGLKDDPYRSIAYYLYESDILEGDSKEPYREFVVADALRDRVSVRSKLGRMRMKMASLEAAYLVSQKNSELDEIPGQQILKPKKCRKLLERVFSMGK